MPPERDAVTSARELLEVARSLRVTHTPIQHNPFLSNEVGVEVWIKRDDLQDHIGSGVKRRAIAAVLFHQAATGQVPVVIDGVPQSNCVMAMAHYCREAAVPLLIILRGLPPCPAEGNYREIMTSGATVVQLDDPTRFEVVRSSIVADLERAGRKPLIVPAGAAAPFALPGSIGLGCEIAEQEAAAGISFDLVVVPVGTGGTITGLVLSKNFHSAAWSVVGVRIDDYPWSVYEERFRASSKVLGQEVSARFVPGESNVPFVLYDEALGDGYGRFTESDIAESGRLLALCGLCFGPTYMLKAVRGLKEMVAAKRIPSSDRVLLVHTGGNNEWKMLKDKSFK